MKNNFVQQEKYDPHSSDSSYADGDSGARVEIYYHKTHINGDKSQKQNVTDIKVEKKSNRDHDDECQEKTDRQPQYQANLLISHKCININFCMKIVTDHFFGTMKHIATQLQR